MKRIFFLVLLSLLLVPAARLAMQDSPPLRLELTGANTSDFPTVILTANVYDRLGQPVFGLTKDNFTVTGPLADRATIVSVENITEDDLAFSAVLAIDTSSSMAGAPFDRAREAAISFVNAIGPNDPVAIVAFDSTERLVQDFTTDKTVLLNAINNLTYGGKTALYDGSLLAVQKAADSGNTRRAVVLLSDGAEFGGRSSALREAAVDEALKSGVPVYTIGLGYGFDRTYLQSLADGTLAKFNESPTPDELLEIYNNLAATLRSQYVVTLNVDMPADGATYPLELQVTTDAGTATASADLRAPIPVPIASLPNLPTEPIAEPTDITAEVAADDAITSAEFQVDGTSVATLTEAPYTLPVDPLTLTPGQHELTFNATDENGDIGTVSGTFEVAALPSVVTIAGLPSGDIDEPHTVVLDVAGQTPAVSATYNIDGGESTAVSDAPYSYSIDPAALAPGEHTLNVDVVNEAGVTTSANQTFSVAALPPVVTIDGLTDGQELNEQTVVTISTVSQTPVTSITASLNGTEIANAADAVASFTLNPAEFQPGDVEFSTTATSESGQSTTETLNVTIAALPPQVTISGLEAGETVDTNRTITANVTSQTPVSDVTFSIDGNEIASVTEAPYSFDLDVLSLEPGPHILAVEAANSAGQSTSADTAFVLSDGPSLTATALVPTSTPTNTPTPTDTPNVTATSAQSTQAAALVATSTADAQLGEVMTSQAASAADAQATLDAESTSQAQATQNAAATQDARATANALATQNARATANAQGTVTALAAANAVATGDAQGTVTAQSGADAQETANANSTVGAANAQATADARATANLVATGTAQSTQNALATTDIQATLAAQSALDAQATKDAQTAANPTTAGNATPTSLTSETQGAPSQNSSVLPILIIVIVIVLIIVILFLILGRRRRTNQ